MTPAQLLTAVLAAHLALGFARAAEPTLDAGSALDVGPVVDKVEWSAKLAKGSRVEVTNNFGDVRLRRGGPDGKLEALGMLQQHDGEAKLEMYGYPDAEGATVTVVQAPTDGPSGPSRPVRADLTVFVPDGTTARVVTLNGLVDAKGLRGDLDAATHGGEVRVTGVSGRISVETDTAPILASLDPMPPGPIRLASMIGDVTVYVPDDAHVTATVATSGEIGTDYSITIERLDGEEPDKLGHAQIGGGGTGLHMASRQGRVRLLRIPKNLPRARKPAGSAEPAKTEELPEERPQEGPKESP